MGLQPTASNTGLLLQCPRPFDPEVEIPEEIETSSTRRRDDAARYGDAFHALEEQFVRKNGKVGFQLIDRILMKHEIPAASALDLLKHVRAAYAELRKWLGGENPFDINFLASGTATATETSYVLRPGRELRSVPLPDKETHTYEGLRRGEIGMTIDLELESDWGWLGIDYKSGRLGNWSSPSLVPQMRTIGLAATLPSSDVDPVTNDTIGRVMPQKIYLAVLDANRAGIPAVYADEYEPAEQRKHEKSLRRALNLIGSGFIRPGPLCPRCPVRGTCPALAVDLLKESTALIEQATGSMTAAARDLKLSPADRLGKFFQLRREIEKLFRQVDPQARRSVEELEAQGVLVIQPDGRPLVFEERMVERIAGKKGFIEILGRVEAERWFGRLRKLGVLVEKKERHLRAVEDRRLLT